MRTRPRAKEMLTITSKKTLWSTKCGRSGEPDHEAEVEYSILEDSRTIDGVRVIKLKETYITERERKLKEIIDTVAKNIGESESKVFKAILKDAIIVRLAVIDEWNETIDDLYDRVVIKKEKVKASPGCYSIIIGDGRTNKAETIINIRS
jgi:hypothetical protein